ncbi:replication initiation protein [Mesorhizobium sp. A623]
MLKTPPPPGTTKRNTEGNFFPAPRGDIGEALEKSGQLMKVAPESPRPAEMMEGVFITGKDSLTADDAALHDLLVSKAYETDNSMATTTYALDVRQAMHYLGTVHRDLLRKSLRRLASTTVSYGTLSTRRYEDVPLLVSWLESTNGEDVIRFQLPEPICVLMRDQVRYAYIELAALSTFRCKYSSRLYRILALSMAQKKWSPTESNKTTITVTPDELATWVSFPRAANGSFAYGKMKERFLSYLMPELNDGRGDFDAIQRFHVAVNEVRKGGRGREITAIEFDITLRSSSHHLTKAPFSKSKKRIGGADAEAYRVNSPTWKKAEKEFRHQLGMMHTEFFDFWQLAIEEALSGDFLTDGYHTRKYRGERLLDACRVHGADYAAWGLVCEEANEPDLRSYHRQNMRESYNRIKEAQDARFERLGIEKKPQAVVPAANEIIEINTEETEVVETKAALFGVKEIIFPINKTLNVDDIDSIVGPAIYNLEFSGDVDDKPVNLTIRHWDGGSVVHTPLGPFHVHEDDLPMLTHKIERYLDSAWEFVR